MRRKRSPQQGKGQATKGEKSFSVINQDAAGIDLGSETHWVAVPTDRDEMPTRPFKCFTADLYEMAAWLKRCGIKTVAMESSGVYWIPVFQILESSGFEVKLVNTRHVKNVPGRKTDILDCQWLQRLHSYGLLSGSFRPENQICVLRSYLRHRDNLIRYASSHVLHMQKALTEMNLHLHKVLTDITGLTGMRIIRAIIAGEHAPAVLASMRDRRVKRTERDMMKALQGDYREEHLFALRQAVELYDYYHQKVRECDIEIEKCLQKFESRIDPISTPLPRSTKKNKRQGNMPYIDLREHYYRITGVDFTQINGLDVLSVQTIISEVGLNPHAFPSGKHFSSWLGLCPNNRITGGKVMRTSSRKVVNRAADAFRMAACTLANSSCALGGFYRRMRARKGAPKAITATAHKLAVMFYHIWTTGEAYADPGADYYEKKYRERVLSSMKKRAKSLGYELSLQPIY